MAKSISPFQVVILSSLSQPLNVTSSEIEQEKWVLNHRHKILALRQYLCRYLGQSCVTLDSDIKENPNWHLNLIDSGSTVIIILSRGLVEFYNKPERDRITREDRHTSIIEKIIKGLDTNSTCVKKHFFLMFYKDLLSEIPVIWQGFTSSVHSDGDYKKVLSIIKDEPDDQKTFYTPFKSLEMIYDNDEAKFIHYWRDIYKRDRSYTQLSMYYIEQKLKPITYEADNAGNKCVGDELMTNQLYNSGLSDYWLSKMIVIQGLSGSGKSAFVEMLCHRWGMKDSLKMFRAVIVIGVNENNFSKPLIELIKFVPFDTKEKKEKILNSLAGTPVLFILDVENNPWRKSPEQFYSSEIGQLLQHLRAENLLVFTNQLYNEVDKDKRIITDSDFIYELQCFDQDQLKLFFRKRNCAIDMKCSEIFQELCKLPIYAVMLPRSNKLDPCTNLTAFCKDIVMQILQKNLSPKEQKFSDSLENLLHNTKFGAVCELAWDLLRDQINVISIDASKFRTQEDCLGFLDFDSKQNDKSTATIFLRFRLKTIQYFLAAFHFVYAVDVPEIGRDFLLKLMADHPIHNMWRFVTGLSKDIKKVNGLLKSLGVNQAPPKLLYVQAISESEMMFEEMESDLKETVSTWINSFNWEKNSLYPSDCLAIVKTFNYLNEDVKKRILNEVTELNFANCNLDNEGMFHLIECLSQLRNVKLVNIGGNPNFLNPLSRNGCVGYVREILRNNCGNLKRFYLCSSGLNYKGLRILKATFLKFTELIQLDLSRNSHLDSKGWSLFAEILGGLPGKKLVKLFLADNSIDSENIKQILEQLKNYSQLELLNFNGNVFNLTTMPKLVEVLKKIRIKRLYLSNCKITNSVLENLLNFFHSNKESAKSLVTLVLSWNEFNDDVMVEMMKSLQIATNLQTLTLNHNKIGSVSSMQILSESLRQMPSLGALYLSQCHIGDDGAQLLCDRAHSISLDLRRNNFTNPGHFSLYAHTIV